MGEVAGPGVLVCFGWVRESNFFCFVLGEVLELLVSVVRGEKSFQSSRILRGIFFWGSVLLVVGSGALVFGSCGRVWNRGSRKLRRRGAWRR